ncbi:MAG: phenylalanine--tRNA ligase subunit beta [Acholeplasmatales bacterium]|jgi:phenylalanyl-tRNA synthetase beta chain|nr:phenylalanine--tRNA ligase subunit beta [Acholeplasmatales bacterium]
MRISVKEVERILKKPISNINELTTSHICEVEEYGKLFDIQGLVIGHVITCEMHPNSDHLHVTTVYLGNKQGIKQIVCGAPNVEANQFVIVATIGTVLPGNITIKQSVIRGVESNGMICSLHELGFEDKYIPQNYKNGIYVFDTNMRNYVGKDALKVMGLDGYYIDYAVTANRPDLLSIVGYTREVGAAINKKVEYSNYITALDNTITEYTELYDAPSSFDNEIVVSADISYYSITKMSNIVVKESPWWIKSALINSNIRPINNVVDISNYIMIKYGLPNHCFDASMFKTNTIRVRNAYDNEKVVTLDKVERSLENVDIVICDDFTPVALAGVMGLENSMINDSTTQILIEIASFNPSVVAATSKRLGLTTDSSLRFSKGIDESAINIGGANYEMCYLLHTYASGTSHGFKEYENRKGFVKNENPDESYYDEIVLKFDVKYEYFNKMLGTIVNPKIVNKILYNLNLYLKSTLSYVTIGVPNYRTDIKEESDVLEEVVRFYGFDKIKSTPIKNINPGSLSTPIKKTRKIRELLSALGLNETISYTLVKEPNKYVYSEDVISILSPLSEDHKYLRTTLLNGLVDTYNQNKNYGVNNVNIFEIGNIFKNNTETPSLGILISEKIVYSNLEDSKLESSFFLLKGILLKLLNEFNYPVTFSSSENVSFLHPYKQASIINNDNVVIGFIGEVLIEKSSNKVYALEIDLNYLLPNETLNVYTPISKYPSITRDIAFVVSKDITNKEIEDLIKQTSKKLLVSLELFDVYTEDKVVSSNYKSMAYHLVFNDNSKTLESLDVDKIVKSVTNRLEYVLKAQIRK